MLGDFNVPNYDCANDGANSSSYCYNKIKENSIHMATCLLEPNQRNNSIINNPLLNFVFSNISDWSAFISSSSVVAPDTYHPPLLHFNLTLGCHRTPLTPHRNCAQGDCLLLYNISCHSDWSCVLNEHSVDSAVNNLTALAREAINLAITYIKSKNSTFLLWFSNSLKIKKKTWHFRRYRNSKSNHSYSAFSYYRKLVKTTNKPDRIRWLKSVGDNLKTKRKDVWKYVAKFQKNVHVFTQLKICQNVITQTQRFVEAFTDIFSPIYNSPVLLLFQIILVLRI
jgi:hypothetical protein